MHLKKNICPFMKHMLILTVNVAVYALVCKLCTHGPYGLLYFEIKQKQTYFINGNIPSHIGNDIKGP